MRGSFVADEIRKTNHEGIIAGIAANLDIAELAKRSNTTPGGVIDALEILNTTEPHNVPESVVTRYFEQHRGMRFQRQDRLESSYYLGLRYMAHAGYNIKEMRLDNNCLKIKIADDCRNNNYIDMEQAKDDFLEHAVGGLSGLPKRGKSSSRLMDALQVDRLGDVVKISFDLDPLDNECRERAESYLKAYARTLEDENEHNVELNLRAFNPSYHDFRLLNSPWKKVYANSVMISKLLGENERIHIRSFLKDIGDEVDISALSEKYYTPELNIINILETLNENNPDGMTRPVVDGYKKQYLAKDLGDRDLLTRVYYHEMKDQRPVGIGISKMRLTDNCLRVDVINDITRKQTLLDMNVIKRDFYEHALSCIDGMTTTKKRDERHRLPYALKVDYRHNNNSVFIRIDPDVLDSGYRQRAQCFLRGYAQNLQDEQNEFYDKLMRQKR